MKSELLDCYLKELIKVRRALHHIPELAMQETQTTDYICHYLGRLGIPFRKTGQTGVIADLTVDLAYDTIAVRAEMDAVQVTEQTGHLFASENEGVMHACGHDAIMAVALVLARAASEHKELLRHNIRWIFEPAEEIGQGANYMIQQNALEHPKPSCIHVFHFGNQEHRAMEIQQSISTAAIGGLEIHFYGKESHFSQYEEGADALYAASLLAVSIHDINESCQTRYPFVLGIGQMSAGNGGNIVAGEAAMKGSLRTFTKEDFDMVFGLLQQAAEKITLETRVKVEIQITKKIPPIINAAGLVEKGITIGKEVFQEKCYLGTKPFLVGDNAAYYLEKIPGMRTVFLAGKQGEAAYPVHNPKFDIDETVMLDALRFYWALSSS